MSELMAECEGTCDRLPSIASASLTQIALSSCCVPVLAAWVLTSLLLTHVLFLTLTGTLKMTFRYKILLYCTGIKLVQWDSKNHNLSLDLFLCSQTVLHVCFCGLCS